MLFLGNMAGLNEFLKRWNLTSRNSMAARKSGGVQIALQK